MNSTQADQPEREVTRTITLELTLEVAGDWPGDEAACDAALAHIPSGVIDMGDAGALLVRSMTAWVSSQAASS